MAASTSKVTDVVSEPRVIVGLDFGTTYSGFAYAHITDPDKIYSFYEYAMVSGERPYCKTLTGSYYKKQTSAGGGWQLKSWGYPARAELEKDFQAVRKHQANGTKDDPLQPTLGVYLTRYKLHLARPEFGASSATALPPGLSVERVITDYLREMGRVILATIQVKYGSQLTMQAIKWCVTVPSIWDNSAKQQMKSCMVGAGLVDGVEGSPHPLTIVLEPEAASFHCHKSMSEQKLEVGDKLLVADVGGGTADIVVQEVMSTGETHRVREVTTSSGGLCGGTYVDTRFIEFLHKKIGPCLQECMRIQPNTYSVLLKRWEEIKTTFGDATMGMDATWDMNLPTKLVTEWENYDRRMGISKTPSHDELELTYEDMQSIFDPVVEQNLDLIATQLAQTSGVKVIVVVGGFAGSPYLIQRVKQRFSGQVPQIISPPNPGSAVSQGAVALALNPSVIVSRIVKKTYGVLCARPFEEGIDPEEYKEIVDGVVKCNNRFSIYVQKGSELEVNQSICKIHKPVYRGQKCMKFELYSSTETDPRYTKGDSVTKEGEIEVDISEDMELDRERQMKLSIFFGRTSLEVVAVAMNFLAGGPQRIELSVKVGYA